MIARFVAAIVALARRHAALAAIAGLLLSLAAGLFAATHLTIDTDLEHLLPNNVGWRRDEAALDRAFPQNNNLLVLVIDGATSDDADRAANALARRLRAEPQLFRYVRQPDGGPFFEQNGLLFLSAPEIQKISDKLIAAQPLIGSMAKDPSLRGLFDTLALFGKHAGAAADATAQLDPFLAAIATAVDDVLAGRPATIPWQRLMTGRAADTRDRRRFVLTVPVLDFASLEPGARAQAEVRRLARQLMLDPAHGVRLRMTGPVALNDDQFATLRAGALKSTIVSIVLVFTILAVALRSAKLVGAILATLVAGLVTTAGFAALAIGSLNLISVAFGVLFIGLAVDFGIQFCIRYRDLRHHHGSFPAALDGAGLTIGPALVLAAAATAIGFLSFVPTHYTGIRELGWIAGVGMLIAIALSVTLLPALLTLLRPRGEPEGVGFRRAAPIDRFLINRRQWVRAGAALLAGLCIAILPQVSFDFDPLDLQNPHSESVATARDLMKDPMTTPYQAEILAPSLKAARALADRLDKLPEVSQAVTAASFIPDNQKKKLAIISDLGLLLGPTLSPGQTLPAPDAAAVIRSLAACRDAMQELAAKDGPHSAAAHLAGALAAAAARGPRVVPALRRALLSGLEARLAALRALIAAHPVTLNSLPPDLRDSWIAPDGRARVEVFPKGDARNPAVLQRFVAAIRTVAPDATGTPVTIQEAGRLITGAFIRAGLIAVAAITVLLLVVLRRVRDVAMVIAPLLLAALITLATTVAIGMKLNYANIIALPLLMGIGVAFDVYFVMNWRAGVSGHLQSSTARAVVFSALTTMSAFGSLALSQDPGTAEMGELLVLSLGATLFCTLFVLPALLGPARATAAAATAAAPRAESAAANPAAINEPPADPRRRQG